MEYWQPAEGGRQRRRRRLGRAEGLDPPLPLFHFRVFHSGRRKKRIVVAEVERDIFSPFYPTGTCMPNLLVHKNMETWNHLYFYCFSSKLFRYVVCHDDLGRRHNHAFAAVIAATAGISGFVFPLKALTLLLSTDDSFCSTQNPIPPPEEGI